MNELVMKGYMMKEADVLTQIKDALQSGKYKGIPTNLITSGLGAAGGAGIGALMAPGNRGLGALGGGLIGGGLGYLGGSQFGKPLAQWLEKYLGTRKLKQQQQQQVAGALKQPAAIAPGTLPGVADRTMQDASPVFDTVTPSVSRPTDVQAIA